MGGTDGKAWIYRTSSYATQPGAPVFGESLSLSINVVAGATQVYDGTLTVQRQLPGKDWKTIATSASAYLYDTIKAVGNANYRVLYSGSGDYAPSSAAVTSKVQRKLTYKNAGTRRVVLSGKVSPKYKGKVIILKQQGKKWKKFKTVRTQQQGQVQDAAAGPAHGPLLLPDRDPREQGLREDARAGSSTPTRSEPITSNGSGARLRASSLARSASTSKAAAGHDRSMPRSAVISSCPMARLRYHFLSLGTTYQGACSVLVRSTASSYAVR